MDFNLETVCAEILSVYKRNAMSMSNAELLRRLKFPSEIVFEGITDLVVRGKLRMTTNSLNQVLFELVEEIDNSEDTDVFNNTPDTFRLVTTESGFQPYHPVKRLTRNQGLQTFSEKLSGLLFNDHLDSMLHEWDELPTLTLPKETLRTFASNPAALSILLDDKLKSIYELLTPIVRTNRDRDKLINSLNEISRLRGE